MYPASYLPPNFSPPKGVAVAGAGAPNSPVAGAAAGAPKSPVAGADAAGAPNNPVAGADDAEGAAPKRLEVGAADVAGAPNKLVVGAAVAGAPKNPVVGAVDVGAVSENVGAALVVVVEAPNPAGLPNKEVEPTAGAVLNKLPPAVGAAPAAAVPPPEPGRSVSLAISLKDF